MLSAQFMGLKGCSIWVVLKVVEDVLVSVLVSWWRLRQVRSLMKWCRSCEKFATIEWIRASLPRSAASRWCRKVRLLVAMLAAKGWVSILVMVVLKVFVCLVLSMRLRKVWKECLVLDLLTRLMLVNILLSILFSAFCRPTTCLWRPRPRCLRLLSIRVKLLGTLEVSCRTLASRLWVSVLVSGAKWFLLMVVTLVLRVLCRL